MSIDWHNACAVCLLQRLSVVAAAATASALLLLPLQRRHPLDPAADAEAISLNTVLQSSLNRAKITGKNIGSTD